LPEKKEIWWESGGNGMGGEKSLKRVVIVSCVSN